MSLRTDRLREIREQHGWSQRELARLCGLGEAQIHRYESGISEPSAKYLTFLAKTLEVSTDFLVGLSDHPRGQFGDTILNEQEQAVVQVLRDEGWKGVIQFSAERLAKHPN